MKASMKRAGKIIDWLEGVCVAGSALSLVLIMGMTTVDVFLRKFSVFGVPALFEITSDYLMVALVFLAVSRVYRIGGHVRVTLVERMLPASVQAVMGRVMGGFSFFFFLLIAVAGWESARTAMAFKETSSSVLAYPLAPALFIVPVGAGLTCARILQSIFSRACPDE